jgi:hypothetical protein
LAKSSYFIGFGLKFTNEKIKKKLTNNLTIDLAAYGIGRHEKTHFCEIITTIFTIFLTNVYLSDQNSCLGYNFEIFLLQKMQKILKNRKTVEKT